MCLLATGRSVIDRTYYDDVVRRSLSFDWGEFYDRDGNMKHRLDLHDPKTIRFYTVPGWVSRPTKSVWRFKSSAFPTSYALFPPDGAHAPYCDVVKMAARTRGIVGQTGPFGRSVSHCSVSGLE
ncbi:hypothetical protein J6590_014970 [Homalodisca vitripennis]|nr:hypothetical protein J6590_014970 [Homalodisca vitripennis]